MIKRYKQNEIDQLAKILKRDGVISVPTDTIYGVCARISSIKAYDHLMKIKPRPMTKFFPIMCANEDQIKDIAIVDDKAEKLIHAFMPGPITLVLRKNNIPIYINTELETIAVRMATSEALKNLILKIGCPIFMSSANRSGEIPCTNLDEIETSLPNLDAMMEGDISFSKASTIIDCTGEKIKLLRSGPISMEQIMSVLAQ